jgi:hypothetical protein
MRLSVSLSRITVIAGNRSCLATSGQFGHRHQRSSIEEIKAVVGGFAQPAPPAGRQGGGLIGEIFPDIVR